MAVGAVLGHGGLAPISDLGARVLAACVVTVDADGCVCATIAELGTRAGITSKYVSRGLAELVAAGLIHTRGQARGVYRYVDARVLRVLRQGPDRKTKDAGWRELRARCGGYERQMRAAMAREKAERARADALAARVADAVVVDANDVAAHLRAETLHALDCIDGPDGCDRCASLHALLTEGEADEAAEAARDRLDDAEEMKAAARAVVDAFADASAVGARMAQAKALQDLERLVRA